MSTQHEDYEKVQSIWLSRKQREAAYIVLFCIAGFLVTLGLIILYNWKEGWR